MAAGLRVPAHWAWRCLGPLALAAATATGAVHAAEVPAAPDPTPAALADLGLAMLRQPGPPNAAFSPLAAAAALGLVHAGSAGAAEREIEALFGPAAPGTPKLKTRWPALLKQLGEGGTAGGAPAPLALAAHAWLDTRAAATVPAAYTQRLATRYGAGATRLAFADSDAARQRINAWTAEHTAGRVAELLPAGSVSAHTQLVLTTAVHFRSPWDKPFDKDNTEPRPFQGAAAPVPTLQDERPVLQAEVNGTQLYALPFAGGRHTLLLALPAAGSNPQALAQATRGSDFAAWTAALQPRRCKLALPRFAIAPQAAGLKPLLQGLGVKTVFQSGADLRPMLGRGARGVHLDDVHHAAGITIDEQGGEAVAAAAATVQAKSLGPQAPACAVDRPFLFAVLHTASGTPLFVGRVAEPASN